MKKLGGWTRLWIFLSVIYAIAVTVLFIIEAPTTTEDDVWRDKELRAWMHRAAEAVHSESQLTKGKNSKTSTGGTKLFNLFDSMDEKDKIAKDILKGRYQDQIPEELNIQKKQIEDKYQEKISNHSTVIALWVLYGLFIWFCSVIIVYLFGRSIGWIIQGFKKQAS